MKQYVRVGGDKGGMGFVLDCCGYEFRKVVLERAPIPVTTKYIPRRLAVRQGPFKAYRDSQRQTLQTQSVWDLQPPHLNPFSGVKVLVLPSVYNCKARNCFDYLGLGSP